MMQLGESEIKMSVKFVTTIRFLFQIKLRVHRCVQRL